LIWIKLFFRLFDLYQTAGSGMADILCHDSEKGDPMTSTIITKLYDQLSSKVGKETAESLITFIEQKIREESKEQAQDMASKREFVQAWGGLRAQKKARRWEKFLTALTIIAILEAVIAWWICFLRR
jgi:hypothetical protein